MLSALVWRHTGDRLRGRAAASRTGSVLGLAVMGVGVLILVTTAGFSGLWFLLLGWFLRSAASSELASATLRHRLGDTQVGEVMTTLPVAVPSDWTVARFLQSGALHASHRVFPVIDANGRPTAVLSLQLLVQTAARQRAETSIGSLAQPLPPAAIARASEPLTAVMARVLLRPGLDLVAVVDDSDQLVGMVTASDLAAACDRSALGLPVRRIDTQAGAQSRGHETLTAQN